MKLMNNLIRSIIKKELEQNHSKLSWTMTEHSNDLHTCNVKSCATEQ